MTLTRVRRLLVEPVPIHRWTAHVFFASVVWPVLTIASAAYSLKRVPYYPLSWQDAFLAAGAGTLLRLPDLILVGVLFFGLSGFIFSRLGAERQPGRLATVRLGLEPAVMFVGAVAGIAAWYPAVLSEPVFLPIDFLPVFVLLLLLTVSAAVGVVVTGRPGRRWRLAGALCAVGLFSPAPVWLRTMAEPLFGPPPTALLLGVDSLSHSDDLTPLTNWVNTDGGTWYERAVTPGLFTNAVWTSILAQQPLRVHGVYQTFQRMRATDATLLHAARAQGYRTIGMFSDQLTAAPGPTAGFDENRSGPVGWRQLLLPIVANSSLLLPTVGSNEAGTFTYDVRREVRRLLRAGEDGQRTFVAAHLTYIHLPAYPGAVELTRTEFSAVLTAPARSVRDRTIDWQDKDLPDDPLPLNHWKIQRVQRVIQQEVAAADFVKRGGRLVVFSDHGSRVSLESDNFWDPRYQHVVLATFGLPPRCPTEPISLIDIGRLLGFSDVHADPSVEFAFPGPGQWNDLFASGKLRWSGEVDLDAGLLAEVFASLQRRDPWPSAPVRCK